MKFRFILIGFVIVLVGIIVQQCARRQWSEKEKQAFADKCQKTDSVLLSFELRGFDPAEVQIVIIREMRAGRTIDSIFVHPQTVVDSVAKIYAGHLDKSIYLHDKYYFTIGTNKPFILSEMKMVMWPQSTMASEGWGCVMGDFVLDGKRFEHDATVTFVKRKVP